MKNIEIGKRIKERRKEVGISAADLANRLNFSKGTIYRYESGDIKAIKLPVIESIAEILTCNPSWLIGKSDQKYLVPDIDENPNQSDVADQIDSIIQSLLNDDGLVFQGEALSPSEKLTIIDNLESTVALIIRGRSGRVTK